MGNSLVIKSNLVNINFQKEEKAANASINKRQESEKGRTEDPNRKEAGERSDGEHSEEIANKQCALAPGTGGAGGQGRVSRCDGRHPQGWPRARSSDKFAQTAARLDDGQLPRSFPEESSALHRASPSY